MKYKLTRREFFEKSLIGGSAVYLSSVKACSGKADDNFSNAPSKKSRIVIAKSELVRNSNNTLNASSIYNLLNSAIENFYEIYPAKKAWARLFSPADTVGIKVNCLAGKGMSSSIELVEAIVENLISVGIKKDKVIIWDRANRDLERAGYKIQTGFGNTRCYGNDISGYTNKLYESRSTGSFLSNILVHQCSAIINVPILKDHGIVGVTNALKNFFGAIHNPNKYHSFAGNPFIADVNLIPDIRNKVKLTITDSLTAQYEGGPPFMPHWSWHYNGLLVGTDMVAIDAAAWKIIEKKRAQKGISSLKEAGREPIYIKTAADADHQLGESDLNKVEIVNV